MSWSAHVARRVTFRSDHGADVSEGVTPSGHYGYAWIDDQRPDGPVIGHCAEWVDYRHTWVLWTNQAGTGWAPRDVDWPAPGGGGPVGVVRERAGGDDA